MLEKKFKKMPALWLKDEAILWFYLELGAVPFKYHQVEVKQSKKPQAGHGLCVWGLVVCWPASRTSS